MMKNCALIYNKNASGFNEKTFFKILKTIFDCGYNPTPIESSYPEFIVDNIKTLNNDFDVILTMGGDGTVSNAYKAFNTLEYQKALYGHIPSGTTNDMGPNTNLPRYNPTYSTRLLLNGDIENRDIISVNGHAIAYVAAGGILAPATFLIDKSSDKKDAGTFSYIRYGAKKFFTDPELYKNIVNNPYNITYEANGQTINTSSIFFAIFNAKSFANLCINPHADMCNGKFNVVIIPNIVELLQLLSQGIILRRGITQSKHTFSTDALTLTFNDRTPFYPLNCDGDSRDLLQNTNTLKVKPSGKVLELIGKKRK